MATSADKMFRVLADPTRRRVLLALLEGNPQRDTALRGDGGLSDVETERLKVQMYHNHLPMMEEAGLISWDRDASELGKGPNFDEIRPILAFLEDDPDIVAKPA